MITYSSLLKLNFKKIKFDPNFLIKNNSFKIDKQFFFTKNRTIVEYINDELVEIEISEYVFRYFGKKNKYHYCYYYNSLYFEDYILDVNLNTILTTFNPHLIVPKLGFTYILKSSVGYKIGHSKKIEERYKRINNYIPFEVKLFKLFMLQEYKMFEKELHKFFFKKRIPNMREWFFLNETDLKAINFFFNDYCGDDGQIINCANLF